MVVGILLSVSGGRSVAAADLEVGDCLYVRTSASAFTARPIGGPDEVGAALLAGGAERAGCAASHGHEVSARVEVPASTPVASGAPVPSTVLAGAKAACEAAFAGYVGLALADSRYETFAVMTTSSGNTADVVCLVARRDGEWMDHPARGSGE